jgi:hypothetical protein
MRKVIILAAISLAVWPQTLKLKSISALMRTLKDFSTSRL